MDSDLEWLTPSQAYCIFQASAASSWTALGAVAGRGKLPVTCEMIRVLPSGRSVFSISRWAGRILPAGGLAGYFL